MLGLWMQLRTFITDLCSLISDLTAALQLIVAAFRVQGSITQISEGCIKALSVWRVIWFVGVQLVRMAIASSLGYGGTRLLCKTVSLEGLLRTTVALKCVCARARVLACIFHLCSHCPFAQS